MTNRGSDCVTGNNLDKRWREDWKGRKKKETERGVGRETNKQGKESVEGVSAPRSDSVGFQQGDSICSETHSCPPG